MLSLKFTLNTKFIHPNHKKQISLFPGINILEFVIIKTEKQVMVIKGGRR